MANRFWPVLMICLLLPAAVPAQELEMAAASSSTARQLLDQADEVFRQGANEKAAELYKLTAEAAEKEMVVGIKVEALAQVARCYLRMERKEEGRHWLMMAADIATDQMPRAWSRYLGVRGRFEWQEGDLEKATATFQEMYDYCLRHDLHERAVDAAHMVAITAPPEEQIRWGRKGIEAAEAGGVESWLGPLWNNLGWTYDDLGRYQESLEALLKAREYHWKSGGEMNKLIADWSVGHAYRMSGQPEEAVRWMRPVLAWAERLYDTEKSSEAAEWIGHSCRELGELALQREALPQALEYLQKARERLREAGMEEWDADGFAELSQQVEELAGRIPPGKIWPTVIHFEIPYDDAGRAADFYRQLFGWEIFEIPEMDYWMVQTVPTDREGMPLEPGVNGGMTRRAEPEYQIIDYFSVESVEESLEKAESSGGEVIVPQTVIPGVGWYANLKDSEGNIFGIIQEDPAAQ